MPIACNRGASGIDGVLSTAAGYAAGLRRGVTLVVGDVSFLHDCNGLSLLRTGGHLCGPAAAASESERSIPHMPVRKSRSGDYMCLCMAAYPC